MSRALDKDIARSMGDGDAAAAAYEAISQALNTSEAQSLLEIEILGKSHEMPPGTYVLKDEAALGVSKAGLVQAFFVAREILKAGLEAPEQASPDRLLAATSVILLMDPEHLTAANTRKRLTCKAVQREFGGGFRLRAEQMFVDSLLTSRLHRHTKSPTLWSHRRWLIGVTRGVKLRVDVLSDMIGVVTVAAERHPRNYYAWSHARWLVSLDHVAVAPRDELMAAIKEWCLRHRDDISGWSFLSFLLSPSKQVHPDAADASRVFGEVLKLAESLRWTNESVWVFLRTLAASGILGDREYIDFQKVGRGLMQSSQDAAERARLDASMSWSESNRVQS